MAELNCTNTKLDTNLKLYYRFSETSGTSVADSSGNSNTGTASRSNILNNPGMFGNGGLFVAASSDKITITDATVLKPTGNYSMGCWVKTSQSVGVGTFFASYNNPSGLKVAGIVMRINGGKFNSVHGRDTGTSPTDFLNQDSAFTISDGVWHLCVVTYDGSNIRQYVDNNSPTTTAWTNGGAGYEATNYVRVGNQMDGTEANYLDGSLDDLFLLNGTVLSSSDITKLYSGLCDFGGGFFI